MRLQRHADNPILRPDPMRPWQALNVFNPGAVLHNGLVWLYFRAQGLDYISRLGLALSADGVHFNKLEDPVLSPSDEWETRGVEDPRITWFEADGCFYMTYTAYSPLGITPMISRSTDLLKWERIGPIVKGEDNKDHVLFPEKVNGRYLITHRRPPAVWLGWSDDLETWGDHQILMEPVAGSGPGGGWQSKRVGAGGVPILTEHGWLFFYHAYDQKHVYSLGVALLDRDDPTKVLHRPDQPILVPEETWELKGDVPTVVFSAANIVVGDQVHVYYGGADRLVGLATAPLADLIDFARHG